MSDEPALGPLDGQRFWRQLREAVQGDAVLAIDLLAADSQLERCAGSVLSESEPSREMRRSRCAPRPADRTDSP
jgi:hypothetical protein